MKSILGTTLFALALLAACRQPGQQQAAATTDTTRQQEAASYKEHAQFRAGGYPLSLQTRNTGGLPENVLILHDTVRHTTDTAVVELDENSDNIKITDLSDSLHFTSVLVLNISWNGDSDMPMDEFLIYEGRKLKNMFSTWNLFSLKRKNETTLIGIQGNQDDIVYSKEEDTLLISLMDFSIQTKRPDTVYIGYRTHSLETLNGYRHSKEGDSAAYTIKPGTEVYVDYFIRSQGLVRLILQDSILVHVGKDEVSGKLQGNNAG